MRTIQWLLLSVLVEVKGEVDDDVVAPPTANVALFVVIADKEMQGMKEEEDEDNDDDDKD